MNTELQLRSFDEAYKLSERLSTASGLLKPCFKNNPGAILMALTMGQELGFSPAASLRAFYVVTTQKGDSNIGITADAMLALLVKRGYKYKWGELSNKKAEITLIDPDGESFDYEYNMEKATLAGLIGKDIWKKYPESMLRARAISMSARAFAPQVIHGIYTKEELDDIREEKNITPVSKVKSGDDILKDALLINKENDAPHTEEEKNTIPAPDLESDFISDQFIYCNDIINESVNISQLEEAANEIKKSDLSDKEKEILRNNYMKMKSEITKGGG